MKMIYFVKLKNNVKFKKLIEYLCCKLVKLLKF